MNLIGKKVVGILPGALLALAVAIPSVWLHSLYSPLSAVAVAMLLGLLLRNALRLPSVCDPGIGFVVKKLLRLAIVLLGVRLSFLEVLKIGGGSLLIVVTCITVAIILVRYFSRLIKLPPRLGILIGVGTSICGNSAIVATAPVIEAEDKEVAFAIATITLFGVAAVLVYPVIGHLLNMTDTTFGTWAGTAINDTSQVVTAGFIYSPLAGKVATVVKLTRNLFIAPVIVIMGILHSRGQDKGEKSSTISLKKIFPLFVLGFVAMAILRTLGLFPDAIITLLRGISNFLIVMCIAGVGLHTSRFSVMRKIGFKPLYVGLLASLIMGGISFVLIKLVGVG
ncbi:MAG: putative sulfate exporter family transporter [Actinobacteria bacterium]|nr:putative sulfate exporter family transporter [Actinomycetota bacterium]